MDRPTPGPTIHTFVIHFWRERSAAAGSHWRGRIEHVQSGQRAAFLGQAGLVAFIRQFGIMLLSDDKDQHTA